jgi:glycosyltransferase involved in cell wall biosynthesis
MSAAVSDDVEMLLDRVEYVGNNISVVTGWAILKNADNNNVKLFACVEDGRKKQYYEVKKHSRQDIGRYYGSEKYTCAGINFKFFNLAGMQNPKVSFILEYCGKYYTNGYTVALNPYEKKEVNDKKKIAFLGEMLPAKGSELVYRIIKAAPVDKYDFYVLGDIGYEPLSELVCDNLVKLGKYDVRDLPFFVSNLCIDLICILPVWPETFCYTLSEAILCDVPVLGTDIGAVGERIKEHGYGWTVDYRSTPDEILKKIGEIFRDTADYDAKRKVAVDFKETTLEDMIKNYKCLYASVEKSPKYRDFCRSYIAENLYIDGKPCIHDETFEERRLKDVNRYQADVIEQNRQTVTELRNIKASRSYRLMYKILKLIGRR